MASQPQENALLVLGLPELFQRQNRNSMANSKVLRQALDQPQVGVHHEAPPGYQGCGSCFIGSDEAVDIVAAATWQQPPSHSPWPVGKTAVIGPGKVRANGSDL